MNSPARASGRPQNIPFFAFLDKSRETWYNDVDLLVLKDEKMRIIVEIEESNLGPTQVYSKYFASALARTHGSRGQLITTSLVHILLKI